MRTAVPFWRSLDEQCKPFLGIGGTGSKAVENFIHVCFSGLGPSNVWLGMVDQDSANGNVAKTKATLDHYIELRNELKTKGKNFF